MWTVLTRIVALQSGFVYEQDVETLLDISIIFLRVVKNFRCLATFLHRYTHGYSLADMTYPRGDRDR